MNPFAKRTLLAIGLLCLASLAAELFVEDHAYLPWESWFGFYPLLGFLSCSLLVLIAQKFWAPLVRTDREPPR